MYISLDPKAGTPLYLQVKQQMRLSIATGVLQPGDQLPTVRDLAARLRINPNTIARVYRELCAEGLLSSRQGSGTFVADEVATMGDEQSLALARQKLAEAVDFGRSLNLSPEALDELFKQVLAESMTRNPEQGGNGVE
jgi:GntR family transcriptional regulator